MVSVSLLLLATGCLSEGLIAPHDDVTTMTTTSSGTTTLTTSTGPTTTVTNPTTTTTTSEPTYEEFDGASLHINAPLSGDFLAYGETHTFDAEVLDKYDNPMGFDEIVWTSSEEPDWSVTGMLVQDDNLDVGRHDITATAELPNGDRLAYTVGGVLLQSVYAGTYAGLFNSTLEYSGYVLGCSGAATLYVDAYGEVVEGDAACIVTLGSWDLDLTYNFDMKNADGDVDGIMNIELLGLIDLPVDILGSVSEDGQLTLTWYDDSSTAISEGDITLERVSLDAGL